MIKTSEIKEKHWYIESIFTKHSAFRVGTSDQPDTTAVLRPPSWQGRQLQSSGVTCSVHQSSATQQRSLDI